MAIPPHIQQRANRLIEEGNAHHAEKRYDKAIAAYREAIRLFPAYASFHLVIGDMLMELGRFMEAAIAYRDTLSAHPDHDQAQFNLGLCLLELGETREGIQTITKAIEQSEENNAPVDYSKIPVGTLIQSYATMTNPETKALWIDILFETNDPRALDAMHDFLVSAGKTNGNNLSFRYWMAQAKALTAVGFASEPRIYEDWRSPNYSAINEDVQKYLATLSKPSRERKKGWADSHQRDPARTTSARPRPAKPGIISRIFQIMLMAVIIPAFFFFTFPALPLYKWIRRYEQRPGGKHLIFIFMAINLSIVFSVMGLGVRYYEYGRYINLYTREGVKVVAEVTKWDVVRTSGSGYQNAPTIRFAANNRTITTRVHVMAGGPESGDSLEIYYLPKTPERNIFAAYNLENAYVPVDTWFLINLPLYALAVFFFWIQVRKIPTQN